MAATLDPLMEAFNRLRKSNPEEYRRAVEVLSTYTAAVISALVDASPDQVLEAQGRARQAKAIFQAFCDCHVVERTQQRSPSR